MTQVQGSTAGRTVGRRALLGGTLGLGALGLLGLQGTTAAGAATVTSPVKAGRPASFVRASGTRFTLGGRTFRFGGTNNYYLHYTSHTMIDSVLEGAHRLGFRVLRAWAFLDGQAHNGFVFQPSPGEFVEDGFEALDYAVWKAGQLGIRLVLPLTNNWDDFGGMNQYVAWFGASHHDEFYTNPRIKAAYKAAARHVITRRNRYTGLKYFQDPTIMTWELANEPRCESDKSGATLLAWADEMSRYLKTLAPHQLTAVGDEGYFGIPGESDYHYSDWEGVRWRELTSLRAIDYGTFHLYPDANQLALPDQPAWGEKWIHDHVSLASTMNRPVVLEEFGIRHPEGDPAFRDRTYAAWTAALSAAGGAGDLAWILTGIQDDGSLYPDYDGFRITEDSSTAAILAAHAAAMAQG